ncbi:MAG: DUF6129 family protein [Candidatus Sedimenticola endophacoides]
MISAEQLESIGRFARQQPLSEEFVTTLREKFPQVHFTYCMDDDVVSATPVYEDELFNLYLIDSRNHCLSFTRDGEIATGVVLAEKEDE